MLPSIGLYALGLRLVLIALVDDNPLIALTIHFTLKSTGGIPAGLLGQGDVARTASGTCLAAAIPGLASADIAGNKERREEIGEGKKIKHVQPDAKGLASGIHAAQLVVLGHRRGLVLSVLDALSSGGHSRVGHGQLGFDGDEIGDERVDHSTGTTNDELRDLHRGECTLDYSGHADVKRGDGVVSVLFAH